MSATQTFNRGERPDLAQITVGLLNELIASPLDKADSAARRTLQVVGDAAGFDRTYIFQLRDGDRLDNTNEWVAAGVEPMIDRLQGLPAALLGPWLNDFPQDRSIDVPDTEALDPAHPARAMLVDQGIRSALMVPMVQDGELLGFLGYDAVRARRWLDPDEVFLLRCAANGVSALLARGRVAQARDRALRALRETRADQARAEARLHDIAAIHRSWVWEQDTDLRFTLASDGSQAASPDTAPILGRTREELVAEGAYCRASADWTALAARMAARRPFTRFDYRLAGAAEGEADVWVRIAGRPVHDGAGRFIGYRGAGSDVSEVYRTLDRAEAARRARATFAAAPSLGARAPRGTLPVRHRPAATPGTASPLAPPARRQWSDLSVLLAADDPMTLLLLRSICAGLGIRADSAGDGHEALGLWKVRRHDLILMDLDLPGMDAVATLAAIRESAALAGDGRPVAVAVTASGQGAQAGAHLGAGFDRCLANPVRSAELEAAVAAFWPRAA